MAVRTNPRDHFTSPGASQDHRGEHGKIGQGPEQVNQEKSKQQPAQARTIQDITSAELDLMPEGPVSLATGTAANGRGRDPDQAADRARPGSA
jgi:hypothetical protein